MVSRPYTASLSQTNRSGWSIIFRHPVRPDPATGRPGLRVRRGLSTRDKDEAEQYCRELNEILADPLFHSAAARAEAEKRGYTAKVLDIFYFGLTPESPDYEKLRDDFIELPRSSTSDFRRVLMLGTTGAGKTTLVRQFIGTKPPVERFPSTSTAKTTTHDTEIVLVDEPWKAVVTFASSDEVREFVGECLSAAVLAASRNGSDAEVLRRLLQHVNQKYRFNYILGNGPAVTSIDYDDEEEEEDGFELFDAAEDSKVDVAATNELLLSVVTRIRKLAKEIGGRLRAELAPSSAGDERVLEELFEEELDRLVREEDDFHLMADSVLDEIEKRFDLLPPGNLDSTRQDWPMRWSGSWPKEQRSEFLRAIARFSSNHGRFFGRLLTPLVNGLRVSGPFRPTWSNETPRLVLMDGEGLGHSPKTTSSLPTALTRRIEDVDAVVLVDNAMQPLQAAPVAAMRELVATGNTGKLLLTFTHFDQVTGDNLRGVKSKQEHILASAENVLAGVGEELGPFAERALRKRIENSCFFLAGIDTSLSQSTKSDLRTTDELRRLVDSIERIVEKPKPGKSQPIYDRMNLVLLVKTAAERYTEYWAALLGMGVKVGVTKEHWTRPRALSRRLATGMADEYDTLRPVADLRKELVDQIYVFLQNPIGWTNGDPTDDLKQAHYDALADAISRRMLGLASDRVRIRKVDEWRNAYEKHGTGSSFARARIIQDEIVRPAAPVPDTTPSLDRTEFLRAVAAEVEAGVSEIGAELR